ncbi:MAG: alpha-1,6-glucosidase domain-containing protein, partial [Bacteroidota bacterium]
PAGNSTSNIPSGQSFDVTIQVWKDGVTNSPGQGADIQCTLYWGEVPAFGGTWTNITETPMTYTGDTGNDDVYTGSISPADGFYEYTVNCDDLTDNSKTWQGGGNGRLNMFTPTGEPLQLRAMWLEDDVIAWNTFGGATYELHYNTSGAVTVPQTAGSGIALTFGGTLTSTSYPKNPNANGYDSWVIPAGSLSLVPTILKGDFAIAAYDGSGDLMDATRIQIQGVLDDLFSYAGDLGTVYAGSVPSVHVWAPTATQIDFHRFADGNPATLPTVSAMTYDPATGVWSITGDASWDRDYYVFEVTVFAPDSTRFLTHTVSDPWAVSLTTNSKRAQILNLDDASLKPSGWDGLAKPAYTTPEDISVYEVHVRDFSINDATVASANRGTFKAFTETSSDGMQHLEALQAAGLSHIHLLPAFDIASVNEDASTRTEPSPSGGRSTTTQQAAVGVARGNDGFNWGYDPYHFGAPEGSYSTDPADGATRVLEFREMVQSLNEAGLRVVMDVVYNHTSSFGQTFENSVLDKIVPGYYHRYGSAGEGQFSSCCADTATEYDMMQKLMVDTLIRWAKDYKVDGFRFDLMNLHSVDDIQEVRTAVDALSMGTDGVDGQDVYIYGEGWNFGSAQGKGLTHAHQWNMPGTGIGTFNDRIRDASHGGYSTDPTEVFKQGFINGLSFDWNGKNYSNRSQGELRYQMDRLRLSLAGNLQDFEIEDQAGTTIKGKDLNGTSYALDPQESINYISKHDNETLYDLSVYRLPAGATGDDRTRVQNLGLSLVALAQGIPFFHMAGELLRSKSLDRNSYDSGDWFNRVDWTGATNNFAVGLPPEWDNQNRWSVMTPLLNDTGNDATPANIQRAREHFEEILKIRTGSPLFTLETAADAIARIDFHNTGPSQTDGLIVMSISDETGTDLDPSADALVVLFNATNTAQTHTIASFAGYGAALHPILAASTDPVVKTSSATCGSGAFTVPARTTAVFVLTSGACGAPSLDIGAWLEGAYEANPTPGMRTDLTSVLPTSQPFSGAPWNYAGTETSSIDFSTAGVVDWILVGLSTDADATNVVSRSAGLLLSDGSIVGTDGSSSLTFGPLSDGSYYVNAWHRNHRTSTLSSAQSFTAGSLTNLACTRLTLSPGDADTDGQISALDVTNAFLGQTGTSGYLTADFNLDGTVDAEDVLAFWLPSNGSAGGSATSVTGC